MSKIRVDVDYPIYDGQSLTFNAPCDCTAADGLRVYYPGGNKTFAFCDAHNRNIYGIGDVFSEGALVKVVLDVTNERAYLQNADYNTYIDGLIRKYGQVKYGTYEGTGDTVASLDFGFEPGLLIVGSNLDYDYRTDQSKKHPANHFVWIAGQSSILANVVHDADRLNNSSVDSHIRLAFTTNENTVSWIGYRHSAGSSTETETAYFNNAGETYYYLAIGKNDALGPDIEPGGGGEVVATTAVLYTPQSLTEAQKAQARKNIGITDTGGGGGSNGITPHIGENGNWYIGTTDTGVKAEGKDGRGIVSVQHTSTSGLYDTYTITYTDKTTSTFTVKNGSDGTSVTVESVRMSAENGGTNIVEFSDGNKLNVKNGYSPVRGVDYDTPEDRAELEAYIATELAKRGRLAPEYAESVEELEANGDQSKMYVLPDGMIYAWMLTEKEVESGGAGYTNVLPTAKATDRTTIYGGDYNGDGVNDGYLKNRRLSSSGSDASFNGAYCTGFISAKNGDVVRIKGINAYANGTQPYVIAYDSSNTKIGHKNLPSNDALLEDCAKGMAESGATDLPWIGYDAESHAMTISLTSEYFGDNIDAFRFSSGVIDDNSIVTVNEKIVEGGTEIVTEYAWASTGLAFVPADYEDRIITVEERAFSNTSRIIALEKSDENGGTGDATEDDALARIRNWDSPIYDCVPTFQLSAENPATTSEERTVASIYAKYDALVAAYPNYITKTDLGVCSDNTTHVYRYDFCEPEPHHQSGQQWSETKPVVICASGIHAEWGGVYSLYYAFKAIAENPALDDLRRNVHFVVVPIISPYCFVGAYSETYGVLNANGVQIHRNFEVGFIYPDESGYQELGTRNHGGTEPLSEIETQNIDNIFKEFPDAALFLTCHSAQRDTRWGTGFIWASTATNYTCNLGYRLVDKMSKAWHIKYGTTWEEGCVRENEYILANPSTYPNGVALADGDYRAGHAHVSATDGTETRQATKYGIQGANVEVLDTFWVLSDTAHDSKLTTHGAEVYINYLLMYMGCYDHKDKKDYAPNLPWED